LIVTAAEAPNSIAGSVERYVYQGGHVDMYVNAPASVTGILQLRLHDSDAPARWPVGAPLGIQIKPENVLLFPRGT
jgi:putative spermidine/putrescine transport system ATP-binding protein/spermidine/putrescine transport system ATP-binding protein